MEDRYWQALTVSIPVWPRGAEHLRFEIVSNCRRHIPLATGFVFRAAGFTEDAGFAEEVPRVLALCRGSVDASAVTFARRPLAELLASAALIEIDAVRNTGKSWASIDVSGFEWLGISSRSHAGTERMPARALYRASGMPMPLALPLTLLLDPELTLFTVDKDSLLVIVPRLIDRIPDAGQAHFTTSRPDINKKGGAATDPA